jgi:hypothetical protein
VIILTKNLLFSKCCQLIWKVFCQINQKVWPIVKFTHSKSIFFNSIGFHLIEALILFFTILYSMWKCEKLELRQGVKNGFSHRSPRFTGPFISDQKQRGCLRLDLGCLRMSEAVWAMWVKPSEAATALFSCMSLSDDALDCIRLYEAFWRCRRI